MSTEIPSLPLGLEASVEKVVSIELTIAHYDARLPAVLSTPAMIGLMEMAAARAVQPALPDGLMTVGTRIEVDHLKACGVGATVRARARLDRIEGRFLSFEVEATYGGVVIGRGRVARAIIDPKRLTARTGP